MVEICAALGGDLLALAGMAKDADDGARRIRAAIADGRAADHFGRMIAAQGGPLRFVEDWARFLPEATVIGEVTARESG
jgi:thymidine phosphorylase